MRRAFPLRAAFSIKRAAFLPLLELPARRTPFSVLAAFAIARAAFPPRLELPARTFGPFGKAGAPLTVFCSARSIVPFARRPLARIAILPALPCLRVLPAFPAGFGVPVAVASRRSKSALAALGRFRAAFSRSV
jgi:hypothetical protein